MPMPPKPDLPPPPKSICNPALSLGTSAVVPGGPGARSAFAAISKDEKTIAFLDNGTLQVADRSGVGDVAVGALRSQSAAMSRPMAWR